MAQHSTLHEAIALLWPELPQYFGQRWPEIDLRLTTLLRGLDSDAPKDAEDELYELFAEEPKALAALNQRVASLTAHTDPAAPKRAQAPRRGPVPRPSAPSPAPPPAPAPGAAAPATAAAGKHERYVVVPVFFGTDREVDRAAPIVTYTGRRGAGLQLGCAKVSIPDDHQMGAIERPRWWRLEFREDPAQHVTITSAEELDRAQFIAQARRASAEGAEPEALVFVHGYNVAFDDAARRAAQIAYDLHFGGIAMLFSWPSSATLAGYLTDENNIRWAQDDFREFLRLCLSQLGLTSVHVVAHSMGNRVLAETLGHALPVREEDTWARLDQVVFAAPDIDTDTFGKLAVQFKDRAARCTLYASSKDVALEQSGKFHGYPRAGYSTDGVFVTAGIDAIDASAVDTSLLGHSYYGDNRSLLGDLFQLVRQRIGPEKRFGLIAKQGPKGRYWEFRPGGA